MSVIYVNCSYYDEEKIVLKTIKNNTERQHQVPFKKTEEPE